MKVVRLAGLQHLARYVTLAINTSDAKQFLVIFLTIRLAVFGHVLAVQWCPTLLALKAPNVPVKIERN